MDSCLREWRQISINAISKHSFIFKWLHHMEIYRTLHKTVIFLTRIHNITSKNISKTLNTAQTIKKNTFPISL